MELVQNIVVLIWYWVKKMFIISNIDSDIKEVRNFMDKVCIMIQIEEIYHHVGIKIIGIDFEVMDVPVEERIKRVKKIEGMLVNSF